MSIFSRLFGRKSLEGDEPEENEPLDGEIVSVPGDPPELPAPENAVERENAAVKFSETFANISELLKTINAELVAQRESARVFQDSARAQIDLMKNLGGKLEIQNEVHNTLMKTLVELPKNLRKIPENAEKQTHLLEEMNTVIRNRGVEAQTAFAQINDILEQLPKAAEREIEAIKQINERVEAVTAFNDTLSKMCDTAELQAQSLTSMEENARKSLEYVSEIRKATVSQGRRSAVFFVIFLFFVLLFGALEIIRYLAR